MEIEETRRGNLRWKIFSRAHQYRRKPVNNRFGARGCPKCRRCRRMKQRVSWLYLTLIYNSVSMMMNLKSVCSVQGPGSPVDPKCTLTWPLGSGMSRQPWCWMGYPSQQISRIGLCHISWQRSKGMQIKWLFVGFYSILPNSYSIRKVLLRARNL